MKESLQNIGELIAEPRDLDISMLLLFTSR